jgi:hypothetical protein
MKKFLLASLVSLTILITTQVSAKTYFAIDLKGDCTSYGSLDKVPEDYKVIPSCDLIESDKKDLSMRDKLKNRFNNKFKNYKKRNQQIRKKSTRNQNLSTRSHKGSGNLTKRRGKMNRRLVTNKQVSHFKKKARTNRNYSKKTRDFINKLRKKGGHRLVGKTTSEDRLKRRTAKHKQLSSTKGKRTGALSRDPKFSTQMKKRREYHQVSKARKRWKSASQLRRDKLKKLQKARKAKRAKRNQQGIKIRRTWKGERFNGSLDGETTAD